MSKIRQKTTPIKKARARRAFRVDDQECARILSIPPRRRHTPRAGDVGQPERGLGQPERLRFMFHHCDSFLIFNNHPSAPLLCRFLADRQLHGFREARAIQFGQWQIGDDAAKRWNGHHPLFELNDQVGLCLGGRFRFRKLLLLELLNRGRE